MRALMFTQPSQDSGHSAVRETAEPRPGPGEVTIDVAHAGINFVDVMARRGDPGYVAEWPYVPGKEVAGTVRAAGPGVEGLAAGQRVAAFTPAAGLAEVARASAALTVPVPDGVPSRVAAAAPAMLATALLLLTDAGRFTPGETVLVHSASGGVGSAVARLVPALGGGRLIGTVGRPEKVAAALSAGYDAVLPRQAGAGDDEGADLAERLRDAAGGGADVVLDALGTTALDLDMAVTAPGGRIVLFGNAGGGAPAPLPPLSRLMGGNLGIVGFSVSALSNKAPHRVAAALGRVLDLVAQGRLEVAVTEVGSLEEVPPVHDLLAKGAGIGKYVARAGRPQE